MTDRLEAMLWSSTLRHPQTKGSRVYHPISCRLCLPKGAQVLILFPPSPPSLPDTGDTEQQRGGQCMKEHFPATSHALTVQMSGLY